MLLAPPRLHPRPPGRDRVGGERAGVGARGVVLEAEAVAEGSCVPVVDDALVGTHDRRVAGEDVAGERVARRQESVGCDHATNALPVSPSLSEMSPAAPGRIAYTGRSGSVGYPEVTKSSPFVAKGVGMWRLDIPASSQRSLPSRS